jgi:hypothetical protein
MDFIGKTIAFSLEREFNHRMLQQKYAGRLDKLTDKKEDHVAKAEDHEIRGGMLGRALARRQYRKADKAQRDIDRINHKISRSEEKLNKRVIDTEND